MKIINDDNYLNIRMHQIGGHLSGIWDQNSFFIGDSPFPLPFIHYITATFTDIGSLIYGQSRKILYHLSGYGSNYQEAKLSFLGESSERYAFSMMPITLKNSIIKSSYNDLVAQVGENNVLPIEYINIFPTRYPVSILKRDMPIYWIKMNLLLDPDKYIYQPLQLVMFNYGQNDDEKLNISAVSTGTASHETIEQALENALIEYLQVDSYNLWWYGGHPGKELHVNIQELLDKYFDNYPYDFLKNYEVKFSDISFDKHIYIVVCEIFGKGENKPSYTVGIQGSYTLERAIYRGFMETLTEMSYSINMGWTNPDILKEASQQIGKMDNLDINVAYYALNHKPKLNVNDKYILNDKRKAKNLRELISLNNDILKWATFVNITPHEFDNLNLNIIRIVAPNLLPVCMPSYPPTLHPRYQETGGVVNLYEHPMA